MPKKIREPALLELKLLLAQRHQLEVPEDFQFSNGWLTKFMRRYGFKSRHIHGESGEVEVNADNIQDKFNAVKAKISEFPPERIYNIDETGFFYKQFSEYSLYSSLKQKIPIYSNTLESSSEAWENARDDQDSQEMVNSGQHIIRQQNDQNITSKKRRVDDESEAAKEFMMALQQDAIYWWDTLTELQQQSFTEIKKAFIDYFGGCEQTVVMALFDLPNLKQKSESMISFSARLKLALNHIEAKMREELKLYFFQNHVQEEVAKEVSRHKPATLDQAIQYAIYLERTDQTAHIQNCTRNRYYLGPSLTSPPTYNQPTETLSKEITDSATPMEDVQMNIQRKGKHKYTNYDTTKKFKGKCHFCKKTGHKIKECWKRKNKENNQQSVPSVSNGRTTSTAQQSSQQIQNIDEDTLTTSVFDYLTQNTQTIQPIKNFPTLQSVQADETNNPSLCFNVQIQLGCITVGALIDTGAEITSMDEDTLQEAQLKTKPASPLYIQNGNKSKSLSDKEVTTSIIMNQQEYQATFQLVPQQNTKVILGMDWLIGLGVYLDPDNRTIIPKSANFNKLYSNSAQIIQHNIPQRISDNLHQNPSLYDETTTSVPIVHKINTGNAPPIYTPSP
ncbi:hypothetical protein INT45_000032 [Circinella minor]|uniref:HTH CENPB-type domain-containing protein n=1 Tax=Circinella minor TaxID=1195481 RepID=A0A8H7RPU4_9FUNG|nr:hypothetical protein INT45_000032 [Circinella minor]